MTSTNRISRRWALALLTLAVTGAAVWVGTPPGETRTPPASQQLPWENVDGSLNVDGIPDSLPALNCAGEAVATLTRPFERVWDPKNASGKSCTSLEKRYNEDAEEAPDEPQK